MSCSTVSCCSRGLCLGEGCRALRAGIRGTLLHLSAPSISQLPHPICPPSSIPKPPPSLGSTVSIPPPHCPFSYRLPTSKSLVSWDNHVKRKRDPATTGLPSQTRFTSSYTQSVPCSSRREVQGFVKCHSLGEHSLYLHIRTDPATFSHSPPNTSQAPPRLSVHSTAVFRSRSPAERGACPKYAHKCSSRTCF